MISEQARVVAVDKQSIWVETISRSSCGSCDARHGCGQNTLAKWFSRLQLIQVPITDGKPVPRLNQQVQIGVPERLVASSALILYFIPLLSMLLAVVLVGYWLGPQGHDGLVAFSALAGLIAGGVSVRWWTGRHRLRGTWQPVLLERQPETINPVIK